MKEEKDSYFFPNLFTASTAMLYLWHVLVCVFFAAAVDPSCPAEITNPSGPNYLPANNDGGYKLRQPHDVIWTFETQAVFNFAFYLNGLPVPDNGDFGGCYVNVTSPQPGSKNPCLHELRYTCPSGRIEGGGTIQGVVLPGSSDEQPVNLNASIFPMTG